MPRILITGLPNSLQENQALRELLVHRIPLGVEETPGFAISADDDRGYRLRRMTDGAVLPTPIPADRVRVGFSTARRSSSSRTPDEP